LRIININGIISNYALPLWYVCALWVLCVSVRVLLAVMCMFVCVFVFCVPSCVCLCFVGGCVCVRVLWVICVWFRIGWVLCLCEFVFYEGWYFFILKSASWLYKNDQDFFFWFVYLAIVIMLYIESNRLLLFSVQFHCFLCKMSYFIFNQTGCCCSRFSFINIKYDILQKNNETEPRTTTACLIKYKVWHLTEETMKLNREQQQPVWFNIKYEILKKKKWN
jgi:hypothetical protein